MDFKECKDLLNRPSAVKKFFFIHYLICSFGLIGLSKYLSLILGSFLFKSHQRLVINDYLASYFFYPEKRYELFHYALILVLLILYYGIVYVVFNKKINKQLGSLLNHNTAFLTIEIIVLFFNLVLLNPHNIHSTPRFICGSCLWLILFFAPLLKQILDLSYGKLNRYYYLLLFFTIVQFAFIIAPFVFQEPKMINEFLDIPEKTFIRSEAPDLDDSYARERAGRVDNDYSLLVDNTTFINEFNLFGTHRKYDLLNDKGQDPDPASGNCIFLPKTPNLQRFLADKELNQDLKYYYDERHSNLVAIDKISSREKNVLYDLFREGKNEKAFERFYASNADAVQKLNNEKYYGPVKDFIKKNAFELKWQILNRWVIHHHNFVIAPMNEYALGKKLNDIYAQYGLLNVIITRKILDIFGGLTYQNYLKLWFSYYYIYYGLLFLLIIIIFQDTKYVALAFILITHLVTSIGFNFLFLGPGLNPIRHFFDIFTTAFLFLYITRKNNLCFYLLLLFSLLGVFNNAQVGLFSLLCLILVLIILFINDKETQILNRILPVVLVAAAGIYISVWGGFGKNGFSKYYLEGLLGFPLQGNKMIYLAVVISLGFALIPVLLKTKDKLKYVALYLFFYSQALLLYYVWGATHNHFLNFAPIYALTVVVFLKLIFNHYPNARENPIITVLIFISLTANVSSLERYYTEKGDYDTIFKVHKTYSWEFERARFTSTMDPKYFIEAVNFINKYSRGNGIYILSKYDSILPFLSKKYSSMPFFDVSNFLITRKEINDCIYAVKQAQSEFIFIDTDINRNLNTDIIHENIPIIGYLHSESVWRVQRLRLLKEIYNAVRNDYRLVQKGYLISVYKRNDMHYETQVMRN